MKKIGTIINCSFIALLIFCSDCTTKLFNDKVIFENENIREMLLDNSEYNFNDDQNIEIVLHLNYSFKGDYYNIENFIDEQEVKENFRNKSSKYHISNNNMILSTFDLKNVESIYVSKYSPFIEIQMTKEKFKQNDFSLINDLVKSDDVKTIYIRGIEGENKSNLNGAYNSIGCLDIVRNSTYTGSGIKVGILEPGIIDSDHASLANTNTVVRKVWYYNETEEEHTTKMAAIIAGTNGIAKDTTIYSVELYGNPTNEIDWLIDNDVDIINLSYGDESPTGSYSSKSAYMDYIAYTYKIIFVASAGNTGATDNYVANPGLGYNVITCGSYNKSYDSLDSFSSYSVVSGPRKPTLVAPGSGIFIKDFSGSNDGTSISSAITSGSIALLLEKDPSLKLYPEKIIALLTANSVTLDDYKITNSLNDKIGSGKLNVSNTLNNVKNNYLIVNNNTSSNTYIYDKSIYLEEGKTLKASIAWLAYATGDAEDTKFTDYDLHLYNSSSTYLAYSSSTNSNIELIEYTANSGGYYTLKVKQYSSKSTSSSENIALAYSIF